MAQVIENAQGGVAVCVDPENFLRALLEDPAFVEEQRGPADIMYAIARCLAEKILHIAAEFNLPIVRKYAAISLPPLKFSKTGENGGGSCSVSRADVHAISDAFVDASFPVTLVQSAFNAADIIIDQLFGERAIRSGGKFISHVVIATGDGRDSFKDLFRTLVEKKKEIHVVCYQNIPHIVKALELPVTCVAHDLIECALSPHQLPNDQPTIIKPKSRARRYKEAVLDIKNGKLARTSDKDFIADIARVLGRKEIQRLPEGTVAHILKKELECRGKKIEIEECLDVVRAFTGTKVVFGLKEVLTINPGDDFFERASLYRAHRA